jgi:Ca-activated chloride channel family protein
MIKHWTLSTLLACTTMACATSQNMLPQPASTAQEASQTESPGAQVATEQEGGSAQPTDHAVAIAADPNDSEVAGGSWLGAAGGSDYVLVGDQEQFIGVWVDVPKGKRRPHVPTAVTLTIDTSGSMQGDKIVQARNAARALVGRMKDGDLVSIQTFSDRAHEIIPPTELNARSRQAVSSTISELSADGATNMFEALNLAIGRTQRTPPSHPVRRVVLISDGRATAGPTDSETLARIAERGMGHGVQVTAMGVGLDYDENALNELAVRSSGRLFHLSDPQELAGIVNSELDLLQRTMATNAFVEVVPAPGVQLVAANGARASWSSNGSLRVPLGTMFAGQRREILVRFRMSTQAVEGQTPIASARLHFRDPAEGGLSRIQEVVVRGQLTTDAALMSRHKNPEAQAIFAMHEASTIASRARQQVASGDFDHADVELARAEETLRKRAEHAKSKRDRSRMMKAAQSIAKNRRAVRAAKKAPPAARPAAARASSLELNDAAMDMQGL